MHGGGNEGSLHIGSSWTKAASRLCPGLVCVASLVLLFAPNNALAKTIARGPLVMLQVRSLLDRCFLLVVICAFVPASSTAAKFFGKKPRQLLLFL